jgi:hypothetical protein
MMLSASFPTLMSLELLLALLLLLLLLLIINIIIIIVNIIIISITIMIIITFYSPWGPTGHKSMQFMSRMNAQ